MYLYAMYSYVHILATGFIFLVIWFFGLPTRKPILSLHERFECGAGWGLERTLNKWVCQQPWRQRLPLSFFEMLDWQFGNWFNGVSPNCLVSFLEKGLVFFNHTKNEVWCPSAWPTHQKTLFFVTPHLFYMSTGQSFWGNFVGISTALGIRL
jgi:hypothetical protein